MDDPMHALLEVNRGFEAQFKESKQEYMDNLHLDGELKEKSIPAKYKGLIQKLMDDQANVLSSRLAVVFKFQIKEVLLHFANNSPDVNGYAIDVVEMLTCGIVANPEDNLTNQLMGTEVVGHLPEELINLEVKVGQIDQDTTEIVLSTLVSSDDLQLQSSTSSHSDDETIIRVINQLPQPVTHIQNTINRPEEIETTARISKKDRWMKLSFEPPTCLVRDCGKSFNYRHTGQDHIEKKHKKSVLKCSLCGRIYFLYRNLYRHYQKEHAFNFQCTFHNCKFTNKTIKQVTEHFEERHIVTAIVNNPEDKSTNQDNDKAYNLSDLEANSEENANVQLIHQSSTAIVSSPVASGSDARNKLPVVQQPSTFTGPNSMKRTVQSGNIEKCNQVSVDGQGQSRASVKKAKLDSTQTNIAPSVDQSRHRCMYKNCSLFFYNLDDLEQHTKLVHSHSNQLISTAANGLTTVRSTKVGKRPIVSQQSSISTESTTSTHIEVPLRSRQESRDIEECIDIGAPGQSSSSANKPKLDATLSDYAQSQVTSRSEQTAKAKCNPAKEWPQLLYRNAMVCIRLKCFKLDCPQMFDTEKQLNDHIQISHGLREFPCPLKNCTKLFDERRIRNDPNRSSSTPLKMHCAKCCIHDCESIESLSHKHHYTIHHSPQYKCTFASCAFTSDDKYTTGSHYFREHLISCSEYACANKPYSYVSTYSQLLPNPVHYHYK